MVMLSMNDNESLMKISGGDIALFEKLTRDFLTSVSANRPELKERDNTWFAKASAPKQEENQAADAEI